MLSRVTTHNVGDVFLRHCISLVNGCKALLLGFLFCCCALFFDTGPLITLARLCCLSKLKSRTKNWLKHFAYPSLEFYRGEKVLHWVSCFLSPSRFTRSNFEI